MCPRQRAPAAVLVTTTPFLAHAPQALAAPMPWETTTIPAVIANDTTSTAIAASGTVTVLCGPPATGSRQPTAS